MRQLFIDFSRAFSDYLEVFEALKEAFLSGETIDVEGAHESVPVHFDLSVFHLTLRDRGSQRLVEFGGVTRPEGLAYLAQYRRDVSSQRVELRVYTQLDQPQ